MSLGVVVDAERLPCSVVVSGTHAFSAWRVVDMHGPNTRTVPLHHTGQTAQELSIFAVFVGHGSYATQGGIAQPSGSATAPSPH